MERKPVDAIAVSVMLLLCMTWGFQQVAIKVAVEAVTPVMQAGVRSVMATLLLIGWARVRGIDLFDRDGTLVAGTLAGTLFAVEFFFIYLGLALSAASRIVVFVNLAPCFTALGLAIFVPKERLGPRQWLGIVLAFFGVFLAFAEGFLNASRVSLLGDFFGVLGGLFWGATTVLIRASRLAGVTATKTLFYQLAVSALALPVASLALGEAGFVKLTGLAVASIVFQGVVVAFASYLVWFWLLTRYLASRIAAFTFLSPLFGVFFGSMLLSEPVSAAFAGAVALVVIGIALVNLRRA